MKKTFALAALTLSCTSFGALFAQESSNDATQLAGAVWKASGGENWGNVKSIDFTFVVEKDGKTVASAEHHWEVAAQTDQVKWKGKDVTVNLADPASDEDGKAAYARWVNDSYWLLAPLKLKDRGVHLADEGKKQMDGSLKEVLRLSFDEVGLTSKDNYRLYINPETNLVTAWDYMPEPGKSVHATWTDYQKGGGLNLSTDHRMEGGVRIHIGNLKVTTNK